MFVNMSESQPSLIFLKRERERERESHHIGYNNRTTWRRRKHVECVCVEFARLELSDSLTKTALQGWKLEHSWLQNNPTQERISHVYNQWDSQWVSRRSIAIECRIDGGIWNKTSVKWYIRGVTVTMWSFPLLDLDPITISNTSGDVDWEQRSDSFRLRPHYHGFVFCEYPSFGEVRAVVFFELRGEGTALEFCILLLLLLFRLVHSM
jgi:hypothetical protein